MATKDEIRRMRQEGMKASKESIGKMLSNQEDTLLRKGRLPNEQFNEIRQRHVWSTYYFTSGYPNSQISAGGILTPANNYSLFTSIAGQNGQGLPQGFVITTNDASDNLAGRVPDDQNFSVWEIGVTIEPVFQALVSQNPTASRMRSGPLHPHDVDQLCDNLILTVNYTSSSVVYGPAREFTQSGGLGMVGNTLLDYSQAGNLEAGPPELLVGGQSADWTRIPSVDANSGNQWPAPKLRRRLDVPLYLPAQMTFNIGLLVQRPVRLVPFTDGGTQSFRARVDFWVAESFRDHS